MEQEQIKIEVSLPRAWYELSQEQLRFAYDTMVLVNASLAPGNFSSQEEFSEYSAAQLATVCFLKWTNSKLIHKHGEGYLINVDGKVGVVTIDRLAAAASALDYLRDVSPYPVRLDVIDGHSAPSADLSEGFSFDSWLACENLWQAYQSDPKDETLRSMAEIIYGEGVNPDPAELLSIFYYWASVKAYVSARFPDFFVGSQEGGGAPSPTELLTSMNAQIRALTKGDITKETEILKQNAIRALTELNAQAWEYNELNKKYNTKS